MLCRALSKASPLSSQPSSRGLVDKLATLRCSNIRLGHRVPLMVRQLASPEQLSEIYIDESSQTQNRYLVLGALIMEARDVTDFEAACARLRLPELPAREMKWGKVSRAKLPAYTRLAEGFWTDNRVSHADFHALVVDTYQLDHVLYNQGDADIGFNKEIYQLATKCARLYGNRLFHVYLDYRNTDQSPEELRLILNRGRQKDGDPRDWPFRRCHFRDSKSCLPLQLVDIFIGAIAFHLNGHIHAENASQHRSALARRIMTLARIKHPFNNTSRAGKFTVWHRRLRPPTRRVLQP